MTLRNAFEDLAKDSTVAGVRTDIGTDGAAPPVIAGTGVRGWLRAIFEKLTTGIGVTGTFWQATQPVSLASQPLPTGASTETTLAALKASIDALSAKVTAVNTGAVTVTNPTAQGITDTQIRASALPVSIASVPAHVVTGTFWQATQPVSLASQPLPSGASTEVTLAALKTSIDALSAKVVAANTGAVTVTSAPTTAITAAALPLPSGAATESQTLAVKNAVVALSDKVVVCDTSPLASEDTGMATHDLTDQMLYTLQAILEKMPRLDRTDRVTVDISDYGIGGNNYVSSIVNAVSNPFNGVSYFKQMEPWQFSDAASARLYQQIIVSP